MKRNFLVLQVIRDDSGGDNSRVVITGDSSQQKKAEDMINSLIDGNTGQQTNFSSNFYSQTASSSTALYSTTKPETKSSFDDVATIDWGAVIKNSVSSAVQTFPAMFTFDIFPSS